MVTYLTVATHPTGHYHLFFLKNKIEVRNVTCLLSLKLSVVVLHLCQVEFRLTWCWPLKNLLTTICDTGQWLYSQPPPSVCLSQHTALAWTYCSLLNIEFCAKHFQGSSPQRQQTAELHSAQTLSLSLLLTERSCSVATWRPNPWVNDTTSNSHKQCRLCPPFSPLTHTWERK